MNYVKLKGVLRNIQFSHSINNTEYDKADIVVKRENSEDDVLSLVFKKFSNHYTEDQEVELEGHVRSYSKKLEDGKNKVEIYVFTYFDRPQDDDEDNNVVELDGRICKMEQLRVTKSGKHTVHFTLANNIISADGTKKINNYIPCVAWGNLAKELSKLKVSDRIELKGNLHSRLYKKKINDSEIELKTAHEVLILDYRQVTEGE